MFPYYFVIPSVCGLFCIMAGIAWGRYIPASLRILIVEAALSIIVDTSSLLYFHSANGTLHNAFCFLDFFLILSATYSLLPKKVKFNIYSTLSVAFAISWVFFVFIYKNNGINKFANYPLVISSLLLTANYLFALYYSEAGIQATSPIAVRFLCFSMITYFCGTFTLFLGIELYLTNYRIPEWFVDINTFLDSVKYIIAGISFYKFKQYFYKITLQ